MAYLKKDIKDDLDWLFKCSPETIIKNLYGETPNDDLWVARSKNFAILIFKILTHLRDNNNLSITQEKIKYYCDISGLEKFLNTRDIPKHLKQDLKKYLRSIPGYNKNDELVSDMHGYTLMYLNNNIKIFSENRRIIIK